MKRLLPLIPLLAVAALALAACGSGGSGPHVAGLTTNAHADPAQHSAAYNSLLSAVKCLRQELHQDLAPPGAERFAHADLARPLRH